MNYLLRYLLQSYLRTGCITFTTADGMTFTCGDGTGTPVTVRFTTAAAQRAILIDPELRLGELYMDGSFIVERGNIADALAIFMEPARRWRRDGPNRPRSCASRFAICINSAARPVTPQRCPSLRSRRAALFVVSGFRSAIQLRLLRDARLEPRRRPTRQAPSGRKAPARFIPPRSRHRLRLGRPGTLHGRSRRRPCDRHHPVQRAVARGGSPRRRARSQGAGQLPVQDYRDIAGPFERIVSVGMFEHVGVD